MLTVDAETASYPSRDVGLIDQIPSSVRVVRTRAWDPYRAYALLQRMEKDDLIGVGFSKDAPPNRRRKFGRWIRGNIFLPDARVGWFPHAVGAGNELLRKDQYHAIMTTGPPHSTHLIGRHLKRKTSAPWVVDMRDLWTDISYQSELLQSKVARHIDRWLENKVLTTADSVISVSDGFGARLCQNAEIKRYTTVANGYDVADMSVTNGEPQYSNGLVIAHVGTLSQLQHSPGLVRAIARIRQTSKIKLRFIGRLDDEILSKFCDVGLEGLVEISGYIPHKEATAQMSKADLLLVSVQNAPNTEGVVPIKTYEYLASGTPILGFGPLNGDLAKLLERSGGGRVFDYEDDLGVENFLDLHLRRVKKGGKAPEFNSDVLRRYDRRELTRQLAELLDFYSL